MAIQTRRTATATTAVSAASSIKPNLTSVFKHSKTRSSTRTLVTKAAVKTLQAQTLEIETLTVSESKTAVEATTNTVKRRKTTSRSNDTANPTSVITTTAKTTTVKVEETKVKAPATNPWANRPRHVPVYAHSALEHLCKVDPALKPLIDKHPYLIDSDHETNYFRVLTRTIIGQQIHWKAARSIIFRFVSYYFPDGEVTVDSLDANDRTFPTPEQVLATSVENLRQCGLSERKASYIQDLARHFAEGKITFTDQAMLKALTDQELASQLLCVRGIGQWTVDMFMMSSLERLDVLPTLDLGVRRGMERHFVSEYKNGKWGMIEECNSSQEVDGNKKASKAKGKGKAKNGEMTCEDMERMAERWRPYRSIASWYMWRHADNADVITAPL
ncbi:hypothetical protein BGZ83_004692 [Gryganskiella cystojenkinii]|nr:hypothetical protein BGZ83_004692 [Gryganskiella cystojenkinii]